MGRSKRPASSCSQPSFAFQSPSDNRLGKNQAAYLPERGRAKHCAVGQHNDKNRQILDWFDQFSTWRHIYSEVRPGKPEWKTEEKFQASLSPKELFKRWQNKRKLIGVRFRQTTRYFMLDIDIGSIYHPENNPNALQRIREVLESIGVCRWLIVRSSCSGGIHLYCPLPDQFVVWRVARLLEQTLLGAGFEIADGTLEVFPNYIPYIPDPESRPLLKGHRLPLQPGTASYLLDEDLNVVSDDLTSFIQAWEQTALGQDSELFAAKVAAVKPVQASCNSEVVQEWKARLEEHLAIGWTGNSQTQGLSKDICIYARVFLGLSWAKVQAYAIEELPKLPGYRQYCGHQRNIQRVVRDWVKTNERNKRYYPIGSLSKSTPQKTGLSNAEREQEVREKIQRTMDQLQQDQLLEAGKTARLKQLRELISCSPATLYRHKDLWHPAHFQPPVIPCLEGDTADRKTIKSSKDSEQLPVIPCGEGVSAKCAAINKTAETVTERAITGGRLLSIYGTLGGATGERAREQSEEREDAHSNAQSVQFSLNHSERGATTCKKVDRRGIPASAIAVGDLVKRTSDGVSFRVRRINPDGTAWVKWLNQLVPLVDIQVPLAELEKLDNHSNANNASSATQLFVSQCSI